MKRHALTLVLAGILAVTGCSGAFDPARLYEKAEYYIPMRDGVRLHTTVYSPRDTSARHPILIQRTPYSCAPYGDGFSSLLERFYMRMYMEEGYILVFQDVRGRYMSEGEFVHMRPFVFDKSAGGPDEASDAYDTVDWLVANLPRNNGRVGFVGGSYPGFYALMGGLSGHPAVKAISPQAPATDWYMGDDIHHNGAFALADAFSFITGFDRPRSGPETRQAPNPDYRGGLGEYEFFLAAGTVDSLRRLINDNFPINFWNEVMRHPDYDGYWRARDARRACYDIKPAVLIVGGHFDGDDLYGTWALYKAIREQSPDTECLISMGPWSHNGWYKDVNYLGNIRFGPDSPSLYHYTNVEIPFFNRHLKSDDVSMPVEPAGATVFFTGENSWRKFETWPPPGVGAVELYITESGSVSPDAPLQEYSFSSYISDPARPVPHSERSYRSKLYMCDDQNFVADRPDVLTFVSDPLAQEMTLAGEVTANLWVSVSSTDADFVVKLIDVFPDDFRYNTSSDGPGEPDARRDMRGYAMLVRGDIMRGRYRNDFSKPEPFTAGEHAQVNFSMPDIAHTFLSGHRIMIQIQSSWFPLFDRNPQQFVNIYRCEPKDFVPAEIKVFHQRDAPSHLKVNLLPRSNAGRPAGE